MCMNFNFIDCPAEPSPLLPMQLLHGPCIHGRLLSLWSESSAWVRHLLGRLLCNIVTASVPSWCVSFLHGFPLLSLKRSFVDVEK